MALETYIHVHSQKGMDDTIASYSQHGAHVDIYLSGIKCCECSEDLTYPERVAHCLDHEIVEVLCNLARYEDGEKPPYDQSGFDKFSLEWHKRVDTHKCKDGKEWTLITA